ncbi:hypothetical protein VZ95_07195 [Elstera litoralis]|uniref:Uncharacterized protein n=2 Tax=Elstera litoralis TaxID=552518 RepID=A0A0F3IU07_9PROT|nr:hypothetical protein VZ95_07195 [Elstera litoralis]
MVSGQHGRRGGEDFPVGILCIGDQGNRLSGLRLDEAGIGGLLIGARPEQQKRQKGEGGRMSEHSGFPD